MKASSISTVLLALTIAPAARADGSHALGDHPAIVVSRLQKTAGYDYASKFYPHPAWFWLYAETPRNATPAAPAVAAGAAVESMPVVQQVARQGSRP